MSLTLFNIYLDQALHNWYRKCTGMETALLYSLLSFFADDRTILAQGQ